MNLNRKLHVPMIIQALLIFQIVLIFSFIFDISIVRQVLGFIYLICVPGFLIIALVGLNKLELLKIAIFSVGLSIAFVMFVGLIVNESCQLLQISGSLTIAPLVIFSITLVLTIVLSLRSKGLTFNFPSIDFNFHSTKAILVMVLLSVITIFSVIGTVWTDLFGGNFILILMLLLIGMLVPIVAFSKDLGSKLIVVIMFTIAISLLLHVSLASPYLGTGDIHMEYFVFKNTKIAESWDSVVYGSDTVYGRLNSMLSITILPTIFSNTLNMDGALIYKILYPVIFAFVPIALYTLLRKEIGKKSAFLAVFMFMAQMTFFTELLGLNRQMIAELFFALLLIVIFSKDLKQSSKFFLFTTFGFSLVVSHYAIAEIFLFFLVAALFYALFIKRSKHFSGIKTSMVALMFVLLFVWYIYTADSSVFESFIGFGGSVISQLDGFFNPASRGGVVLIGLGMATSPSPWNIVSRLFAYAIQLLIIVGFATMIIGKTKNHFHTDFRIFSAIAIVILAMLIIVPGLANTMGMNRFYHILLLFLAPFFIIGGEYLAKLISKRKIEFVKIALLLFILIPYFFFQTGLVYEVTGSDSWSIPLSKEHMNPQTLFQGWAYVNSWKAYSAEWLSHTDFVGRLDIYADKSAHELGSYGMVPVTQYSPLSNTTLTPPDGIVYLSYVNIIIGEYTTNDFSYRTNELIFLDDMSKIYSNSAGEIYVSSNLSPQELLSSETG